VVDVVGATVVDVEVGLTVVDVEAGLTVVDVAAGLELEQAAAKTASPITTMYLAFIEPPRSPAWDHSQVILRLRFIGRQGQMSQRCGLQARRSFLVASLVTNSGPF
jgi:hypothetical protein